MRIRFQSMLLLIFVALLSLVGAVAQMPDNGPGGERGPRGDRLGGTITAIQKDSLTIQGRDGNSYTVKFTDATRFRRNRADAHLSDFKVGDRVFVAGDKVDEHTYNARMIGGGDRMGAPMSPEDMVKMGLGTRFVVGEVTSIEDTKITVHRPDGVDQTIQVDENTSFKDNNGDSVTLADIKQGDQIGARGEMKDGVFTATTLRTGLQPPPGNAPAPQDKPKQ